MLQPDLLSPSACAPANLPESLAAVDSPLITQDWTKWLAVFPDARLDDSLLRVFKLVCESLNSWAAFIFDQGMENG